MPLKRSLQYLHAAWVYEGANTEWRFPSAEDSMIADKLFQRLKHLTRHV